MAARALSEGIKIEHACGDLKIYMMQKIHNNRTYPIIYRGMVYIFNEFHSLVTVHPIPGSLRKLADRQK